MNEEMNQPVYRLTGWSRRPDGIMGSCCFTIDLDARFAERARAIKCEYQQRFNEHIRNLTGYKYARASFLDGTFFLRSMSVEGNCACLGMSGQLIDSLDWSGRDTIAYSGHNVDSKEQAYDLLTIFVYWVETVKALST